MCGITGICYFKAGQRVEQGQLERMANSIVYRGPDEGGYFIDQSLGFAHRRLSILDVAHGQQPMSTDDGRFTIVFNGEIYNYITLRDQLTEEGQTFSTQSDTEVVLKIIATKGNKAISLLNGMFAFAIWDKVEKKLTLSRDRAGIKPLYFAKNTKGFVFGSEIKTILSSEIISTELNIQMLPEYFTFHHVSGPENLFSNIKSLAPGSTLTLQSNKLEISRYVTESKDNNYSINTFRGATNRLDELLNQVIHDQMVSDVPLGTFCSGGIDSSLVTAIASKYSSKPINTFSVGFKEAEYDESMYARMVSNQYGTHHHTLELDPVEFAELLPKLIWHADLPLNFTNSVHIYAISKLAKEFVTVVLTGEGADELFGGYPRYYIPNIVHKLTSTPKTLRKLIAFVSQKIPDDRFKKLSSYATRTLHDALLYNPSHTGKGLLSSLLINWSENFTHREAIINNLFSKNPVEQMMELDIQTYLLSILNRQDKMSMAASIESRVPFLDNRVIDFAQSIPINYKQTLFHRKRVLKSVANRYLPKELIERRKSGFGVPIADWMRNGGALQGYTRNLLTDNFTSQYLDTRELEKLIKEHESKSTDHSDFLWSAINLSIWREQFNL